MSTDNTQVTDLPPENYDTSGKSIMDLSNDIDFTDPGLERPEPKPAEKPAEKPVEKPDEKPQGDDKPDAKPDATPKKDEKPADKSDAPDPFAVEEEFFTEKKDEKPDEKKDEKPVEGFDENAFDTQTKDLAAGISDKKANEKFVELRAELKESKKQLAANKVSPDVQAELDTLRVKAQEAEGLRQRLTEVSSISAKVKLEQSTEYDEQITQPAATIFAEADEISKIYDLEPSLLRAILREGDRKKQSELIEANLEKLNGYNQSEVYRLAHEFRGLVSKRDKMLSNAEAELEKADAKRVAEEARVVEEHRSAVQGISSSIWDKYQSIIPGFEDENGVTADFKELKAKALSIDFVKSTARDQAFAAFTGVAFPYVLKKLGELTKELAARDAAEGKKGRQGPRASESVKPTEPKTDEAKGDTFMERMNNAQFA